MPYNHTLSFGCSSYSLIMPTNSDSDLPYVYDHSKSQNHLFPGAKDTEINPGTVISLKDGATQAQQTMFARAVRTQVVGGLLGANLTDQEEATYERNVSVPFAQAYLVLRQEDLELRKEELSIRQQELALQERRHEKDVQIGEFLTFCAFVYPLIQYFAKPWTN